jgi:hypothetical protein
LQSSLQALAAQLGDKHVLYARGEQLLARMRLQQHRPLDARRAIDSAERKLQALGAAGAPYLPEIDVLRKRLAEIT